LIFTNEFYGPGAHKKIKNNKKKHKHIGLLCTCGIKSMARRGRQIITDIQPGLKENM
jgi:hypothetical protein